jgi:hypothetical protein
MIKVGEFVSGLCHCRIKGQYSCVVKTYAIKEGEMGIHNAKI